jgi:hypothetical protein
MTKEVVNRQYTWMFSGGEQNGAIFAGVAIVIKNGLRNCLLKDAKTVNDRLMWIQLKGIKPITVISCYAPTGAAEYDTEVCFYNSLHETVRETCGSGAIFAAGDFNVRLRSDDVCGVKIGPHIFRKGDRDSMAEMRGVIENRELFREAIEKDNLIVMNTHFTKQEHKLITYKEDKSHPGGPPYDRSKYDTLDFILVPQRWRNSIRDVENDIDSGINSDHYPLIAKVHIRLKARIWAKKKTWVYHKCNDEQRKLLNQTLRKEAVRECNADYQSFACWALKAEMLLPKTEKHKNQPEI